MLYIEHDHEKHPNIVTDEIFGHVHLGDVGVCPEHNSYFAHNNVLIKSIIIIIIIIIFELLYTQRASSGISMLAEQARRGGKLSKTQGQKIYPECSTSPNNI